MMLCFLVEMVLHTVTRPTRTTHRTHPKKIYLANSGRIILFILFSFLNYKHQMLQNFKHLSDLQEVSSRLRNVHQLSGSNGAFAALLEDGQIVTWGSPYAGGDSSGLQDRLCPDVRTENGRIKLQSADQGFKVAASTCLKSKARTRSFEVHNFELFRFVLQHYLNPF